MITHILIKMPKGGDPFWANSARNTLSAMILYSIYKEELENKSTSITEVKNLLATISADLSVFNSEYVRDVTSKNSFSMENIRGESGVYKTVRKGLFLKEKKQKKYKNLNQQQYI